MLTRYKCGWCDALATTLLKVEDAAGPVHVFACIEHLGDAMRWAEALALTAVREVLLLGEP